jgi:FAD/FMN-containing dehydrogenase
MKRRTFCKSTLAAAAAATFPACGTRVAEPIAAVGLAGEEISLEAAAVQELGESLSGRLLLSGNEGYEVARKVWNGMIDRHPALIAVCTDAADVQNAVTFAGERGLLVAVRGGGHSFPGKSVCEGGLMIDLSSMHSVEVDAENKTAVAGGGALLGHLDTATFAHKLAVTTGVVSHTGVGGFTTGGGMGRIDRKFGLAIDNVISAELVTADGKLRQVSAEENPDLHWAIRGGGGNFGVVTAFKYQLHDFDPQIYGGNIFYPLEQAKDVLLFFAQYTDSLPDEANVELLVTTLPEVGRAFGVQVVYAGDHGDGEKVFAPLRAFGKPVSDDIGPMPYETMQTSGDAIFHHGLLNYLKSGYLAEFTPAAIDDIVGNYEGEFLPDFWTQHLGGRVARVAPDATAFAHRNVHSNFGINAVWEDESESEQRIAALRKFYAAVEPHMAGFYTNLNEDTEAKTWGNYGVNYPRLAKIKGQYDPDNLFRLNANIKPEAA